ncbi:MAG: hypothetical protein KAG82_10815 [Alcanivoracaceae bacterium]|nr:hypothetical protein [Alcanivoracaceae bacterium]
MSEANVVLKFDWPAPEPLKGYVEQAESDDIDEAPFEALPAVAEQIADILEDYPGGFYRVESIEIKGGRVSLGYFLDEDAPAFIESLMLLFDAVGAENLEAFIVSEDDNTTVRCFVENGEVWEDVDENDR